MIKVVFLDVGNILLRRVVNPLEEIAEQLGEDIEVLKLAHARATGGDRFKELWDQMHDLQSQLEMSRLSALDVLNELNRQHNSKDIDSIVNAWTHQKFAIQPGVKDTLKYLKRKYRLAIISNAMPSRRYNELTEHDLLKHFDAVILSREIGVDKPNPKIFTHALGTVNIKAEEAAFVDDMAEYLKGAQSVGIKKLFLQNIHGQPVPKDAIEIQSISDLKKYL